MRCCGHQPCSLQLLPTQELRPPRDVAGVCASFSRLLARVQSHINKPNVTSVVACSHFYFQERNQPHVLPHGQIPPSSSVVGQGLCRELLQAASAPVLPALHLAGLQDLCQDRRLAFPRSNPSSPRPSLEGIQLFLRRSGLPIWSQDLVCHPAWPPERCSFPQTMLRLSPMGLGWAGGVSTWPRCCAGVMFLQFSLGGPSYFGDHLMDLAMGGLMCGDFLNAFIPAVHPLFPKAGPTGQAPGWLPGDGEPSSVLGLFSPGWRWARVSCHGAGVWTAPDCPHPLAVPHPGSPGSLSPEYPRMGIPFPLQSPL